jgi:hypothetical protein
MERGGTDIIKEFAKERQHRTYQLPNAKTSPVWK